MTRPSYSPLGPSQESELVLPLGRGPPSGAGGIYEGRPPSEAGAAGARQREILAGSRGSGWVALDGAGSADEAMSWRFVERIKAAISEALVADSDPRVSTVHTS